MQKLIRLQIHIEESGLRKIIVTDNGEGMDKEDLRMLQPHTTSKYKQQNNSLIFHTLGFVGSACKHAAISNVTIQSKTRKSNQWTSIR